jgi:hypothetical protein
MVWTLFKSIQMENWFCKKNRGNWIEAAGKLSNSDNQEIASSIQTNRLLNLEKAYQAGVYDGSQWVFTLAQGTNSKAVYFDNHFPTEIVEFASKIDQILGPP